MFEECKGCSIYQTCGIYNIRPLPKTIKECPCVTCLIKVRCRTKCDARIQFFDELTDNKVGIYLQQNKEKLK